jgi:protein-arginine kinase activator protein McsA
MAEMICPKCKCETKSLILDGVLMCRRCYGAVAPRTSNATLHIKAGLQGEAKNITIAEKNHIMQRTLAADGQTVVHKNNPKKRWKF